MRPLDDYDVYIFDCDGVILDSNELKISAMKSALLNLPLNELEVLKCVDFFSKNFGKSRFYHVNHFLESILTIEQSSKEKLYDLIIDEFGNSCKKLYLSACETNNFINFINGLEGKKYVASGSEQEELRNVFELRKLACYFEGIFGSPTNKSELVRQIITEQNSAKIVMIGDAISDLNAAIDNNIDFIAYTPYSNVKNELTQMSLEHGFLVLSEWPVSNI
jgi:phosphoglycolate phosphatase-like HAD superfamily hydrolase